MGFLDRAFGYVLGAAATIAGVATGNPALIAMGATTLLGSAFASGAMRSLGGKGIADSPTYGFDQAQNVAFDGAPRFVVLGEERIAPSYVSFFTYQSGDRQVMNALLYAGEGGPHGIESLTDFQVNDQPVGNFQSVTFETRLGTSGQSAIADAEWESFSVQKNASLTGFVGTSDSTLIKSLTHTTTREVEAVGIVMAWYNGLSNLAGSKNATECLQVHVKKDGEKDFTVVLPDDKSQYYDKTETKKHNLWAVTANRTSVYRGVIWFRVPKGKGVYTVMISRASRGTNPLSRYPTIVRIEEMSSQSGAHPGKALILMKALAEEQLSGGLPKVTCLCRGWKVKNQGDSSAAWTRNPSKLLEAVLTDANDGCGDWITSSQLDNGSGGSFRTVAARCNADAASSGDHKEARWQLDYVMDSRANAQEHLNAMLSTFRASLVEWGGVIHLVQDYPGSPVATFDARQARSSSHRPVLALPDGRADLVEHELPGDDASRPTHVKIQYRDRADDYARRWTDELVSPEWSTGQPVVRMEVFLVGVTRETQAIREARFLINRGRLRTLMAEFGVGIGDLDLIPGDIVAVYADYPPWSGKQWMVQSTTYDTAGKGRIRTLEYSADCYADTSDKLPARPAWVSRQEALKKARQTPRGATSVFLQEISE